MFIWPNGSVTGSVLVAELDKFREALHAGESLAPWAKHIPDGVDASDYRAEAFPLPEKPADDEQAEAAPAEPAPDQRTDTEREADEQSAAAPVKRGPGRPRKE